MSSAYSEALSRAHPLSRSETAELYRQMHDGSAEARWKLIESILRLAYQIAIGIAGPGHSAEDLVGEANALAIRSVDYWQPERGELSTIATACIRNGLFAYLKRHSNRGVYGPSEFSKLAVPFSVLPPHPEEYAFDVPDTREHGEPGYCMADVEQLMKKNTTAKERRLFRLRYYEKFGFSEIGERLGLSASESLMMLNKLVRRLRRVRHCAVCGNTFIKSVKNVTLCSERCYRKSRQLPGSVAKCKWCKTDFLSQHGKRFCSKECNRASDRNGNRVRRELARLEAVTA